MPSRNALNGYDNVPQVGIAAFDAGAVFDEGFFFAIQLGE
jgi:hypothetical protein